MSDHFLTIKLVGTEKTLNKLIRRHNVIVNKNFRQSLRGAANMLKADEVSGLPSVSGRVRRGVKVRAGKGSRKKMVFSYKVMIKNVPDKNDYLYFASVEFGSAKMKAKHDFQRIADRNEQQLQAKIASGVATVN